MKNPGEVAAYDQAFAGADRFLDHMLDTYRRLSGEGMSEIDILGGLVKTLNAKPRVPRFCAAPVRAAAR